MNEDDRITIHFRFPDKKKGWDKIARMNVVPRIGECILYDNLPYRIYDVEYSIGGELRNPSSAVFVKVRRS